MLEVPAVWRIAEKRLVANLAELQELAIATEECADDGNWVGFLNTDRAFHLAQLRNFGNARLLHFVGALRDQSRLYGLDQFARTSELIETTREHDKMRQALCNGRADEAATLMDCHPSHTRGTWAGQPVETE